MGRVCNSVVSFLMFCLLSLAVQANNKDIFDLAEPYFESIGNEDSLPLCCTAVRQDKQGFVWIGSQKGLVRYDGYKLTSFLHSKEDPNSIAGNYIQSLFVASDGRIWIGTVSSGISVYNPATNKFTSYQNNPNDKNSLSHNRVFSIVEDKLGNLWLATRGGLNYFEEKKSRFTRYINDEKDDTSLSDNMVHSLLYDKNASLWVGTNKGLDKFDSESQSFKRVSQATAEINQLTNRGVTSLLQAVDGKVWVGTKANGVVWLDPQNNSLHRITNNLISIKNTKQVRIKSITQPVESEIWLGSFGDGVYVLDSKNGQLIKHFQHDSSVASSINFNHIGELWHGEDGQVWIATWGGGLNRYNPANAAFRVIRQSPNRKVALKHPDVSSILELNNGDIWLGSHGNGIQIVDPKNEKVTLIEVQADTEGALADGFITGLMQFGEGDVWVGSRRGLQRFDVNNKLFINYSVKQGLPDNYIRKMVANDQSSFWIATDTGVVLFNLTKNLIESPIEKDALYKALSAETVSSLVVQQDGSLWIGSSNGLFLLPAKQTKLVRFLPNKKDVNSLSHNSITGLMIDREQNLWIDTTLGLDKLISWDGVIAKFESINNSMNGKGITTGGNIQEDSLGRIWSQSAMVDLKNLSFISLGRSDGVDFGTFWINAYEKTIDGHLLYGGSQGLLVIKPELYEKWNYKPSVIVSEIKISGEQQSNHLSELILEPLTKSFSVEFSSSDLSDPDKIRYAYYLEGYDNDWIETGSSHRVLNYTNLDPGNYSLVIKTSNRLGEWSDKEYRLPITQLPDWFQTLWFKLLVVVLALSFILVVIRFRVQNLKKQRQELRQQVAERTNELEVKNQELKDVVSHLEEISLTDQSTKAYNRRFINKFIEQDLSKLKREHKKHEGGSQLYFGFLIIDIDHFKYVNDAYGHGAGDEVLRQFVEVLHSTCRESDWVIRWGGEEFLVVARYVEKEEITQLAERIRINVENSHFKLGGGQTIQRTCSVGTASYPFIKQNIDALTWEQTLNLADLAMYIAKNNGRNLWVSLTEKNIKSPEDFYHSAITNICVELNKESVELDSSKKEKVLKCVRTQIDSFTRNRN